MNKILLIQKIKELSKREHSNYTHIDEQSIAYDEAVDDIVQIIEE